MTEFDNLAKRWGESILSEEDTLLIVGGDVVVGAINNCLCNSNNCKCNTNNCSCGNKINNCNCKDGMFTGNDCLCTGTKPNPTIGGGECPPGFQG